MHIRTTRPQHFVGNFLQQFTCRQDEPVPVNNSVSFILCFLHFADNKIQPHKTDKNYDNL